MRNAFAHQLNTCHKSRTDGTHAGCQNAELALGRRNLGWSAHAENPRLVWTWSDNGASGSTQRPAHSGALHQNRTNTPRAKAKLSMMREAVRICNAEKRNGTQRHRGQRLKTERKGTIGKEMGGLRGGIFRSGGGRSWRSSRTPSGTPSPPARRSSGTLWSFSSTPRRIR